MELELLTDLVILFGVSIFVILIFNKLKIPSIVGFLLTGILAGPYGFALIGKIHQVELLAEIGIILLLFTIGIEFSFREIASLKKDLIFGGGTQVIFTTITIGIISSLFFFGGKESIFIGFIVALSSTAVVIKILSDKGEMESPQGKIILALLIAQDIIAIPMILLIPYLAGASNGNEFSISVLLIKSGIIITVVFLSAKYIVPFLLFQIARTRIRELFLISILVICFGIVWISASIGISVALGAFMAGLIISESDFSQQALGNILPFRDIFISIFFVSIGMLLKLEYVYTNILTIILLTLLVIGVKSIWGIIATLILKYPIKTAVIVGVSISQIGEFSFILAKTGLDYKIIHESTYQLFLGISIMTIGLSPFMMKYNIILANYLQKKFGKELKIKEVKKLKDHLIIVGYGVNGKNLSKAAISSNIPYVILEINPDTVEKEKKKGLPIYYGDAATPGVLHQLNVLEARIMVIAINDPYAVRRVVSVAKDMNPNLHLIVRTRYISEINSLIEMGADEVIPEEYETSIEIFTRVLLKYLIPLDDIEKVIDDIRANSYKLFRAIPTKRKKKSLEIPEITISSIRVGKKSKLLDKTLNESDFRNNYKASVLFVRRKKEVITNPNAEYKITSNDILYVVCEPNKVNELRQLLNDK